MPGYFFLNITNWTIFRGNFYAFKGLFLMSMYRMEGGIFGLLKISNFSGCLKFLFFFNFFFWGGGG